jgi:16S rRNA (cytosine967-C5)-methyltransferase
MLLDVTRGGGYAGLVLSRRLRESQLSELDRAFATELFYGTLERSIQLDFCLSRFMERPMQDDVVHLILQMGAYQILFMDRVPDFAVCNQQVELVRHFRKDSLAGMVNAVLRNLARGKDEIVYPKEGAERLSILGSCPPWLAEKLIGWYGEQNAEGLLLFSGKDRPMAIRPNLSRLGEAEFEKRLESSGVRFEKSAVPHLYRVWNLKPGHPLLAEGVASVMGEASALAVMAVGVKGGMQILDACAAPGGKACYMAELLGTSAGRVHAFDLHEHRVQLIQAYAKRLGLDNVRARQRDSSVPIDDMAETLDAVLVDAPCSGLGVMHEKPDIKLTLQPETLEELPKTQAAILEGCSSYLKPGGALVYSTCTLNPAENEEIVRAFLAQHPEFEAKGLERRLPEAFAARVSDGMANFFPHLDGVDGFFIARLEKKGQKGRRA